MGCVTEHGDEIIRMRLEGKPVREISEHFGLNYDSVRSFLNSRHINLRHRYYTDEDIQNRLDEATGGLLEYLGGYVCKDLSIRVRCRKCGHEFENTFHYLTQGFRGCRFCRQEERYQKRKAEIEATRKKREEISERRRERLEQQKRDRVHQCPICGKTVTKFKYCSAACRQKARQRIHDLERRIRMIEQLVDDDITLEAVYRKYNGVCQLCGCVCDWDDHYTKNGYFVAGKTYPSIDHIIPLSKGGEHSWNNVQLTCCACNIKKGAKI